LPREDERGLIVGWSECFLRSLHPFFKATFLALWLVFMSVALVGLGSNLGDRAATLLAAANHLQAHPHIHQLQLSALHETKPMGGPREQPLYLNAALRCETSLSPEQFFHELQSLELSHGRERTVHWSARTLDLDLLLFGDQVLSTPQLTVPHRLLPFRRFVLEPAVEIAADMLHPQLQWSVSKCFEHLQTAPPRFEIWSTECVSAAALLAAARAKHPALDCELRCWEQHDLIAWEQAAPPKARFVWEPNGVKITDTQAVHFVEMIVCLDNLVRVPHLMLSTDLDVAAMELVAAVESMQ
jgi:2-amino-4-hydroxy-6-hydroxymethyldihydropteridine diphosphokinase